MPIVIEVSDASAIPPLDSIHSVFLNIPPMVAM